MIPTGVRPAPDRLLALRRYGAEMRRLLALDAARQEATHASAARSQGMDYAESRLYSPGDGFQCLRSGYSSNRPINDSPAMPNA